MKYFNVGAVMAEEIKSIDDLINKLNTNKTIKFKVKAIAGSKVNQIEFQDEFVKIKIKQRALEGKANKAIIEYLAEILNIPKTKIEILIGQTSSIKTIEIKL